MVLTMTCTKVITNGSWHYSVLMVIVNEYLLIVMVIASAVDGVSERWISEGHAQRFAKILPRHEIA